MIRQRKPLPRSTKRLKRSWLRPKARQSKGPTPLHPNLPVRLDGFGMHELRNQAFQRSGGFCESKTPGGSRCMAPITWFDFDLAHVISRGKGGSDTLENVLCKCRLCHRGGPQSDHPGPQWTRKSA